jgi:hypothetical protein
MYTYALFMSRTITTSFVGSEEFVRKNWLSTLQLLRQASPSLVERAHIAHLAVRFGSISVLSWCFSWSDPTDNFGLYWDGRSLLHAAIFNSKDLIAFRLVIDYLSATDTLTGEDSLRKKDEIKSIILKAATDGISDLFSVVTFSLLLKYSGGLLDVNSVVEDNTSQTALHIAVKCGHQLTVVALLLLRPNLEVQDNRGNTALQLAVEKGHHDISTVLMQGF